MKTSIQLTACTLAALGALAAQAAVTADEAKQLGTTLTPFGAIKAGNKEGTIPEYTGEVLKPPAGFDPKNPGYLPDPFADEKPVLTIDAKNMAQHADKLAEGVKALLTKYPGFRLDVYPTHRTMVYPKYALDNMVSNATKCKLVDEDLEGECKAGLPFPMPKTGDEVIFNKILAFTGTASKYKLGSYVVDKSGKMTLMGWNNATGEAPFWEPSNTGEKKEGRLMMRFRYDTDEPARSAGERILLTYPIDQKAPTPIYQYLPGQRRVKLSPDLQYDTPNPQSGGTSAMDEIRGFFGRSDRFEWKLVGKKEMYIPYNVYKMLQPECSEEKSLTPNHINPACMRWELRRVWQLEATLKPGRRHIFSKRMMYIEEDAYHGGIYEGYDASGKLYRTSMQFPFFVYSDPSLGMLGQPFATYDHQTGAYGAFNQISHGRKGSAPIAGKLPEREYTPGALAGSGIR
jgi:hypothetical protein